MLLIIIGLMKIQSMRNEGNTMENRPNRPENAAFCPFLANPFENCYCLSTSSLYTEATVRLCGGNFEECEIYEMKMQSRRIDN